MKFLCYAVYSGDPNVSEPVGYCAISDKIYYVLKARDMYNLKQDILLFDKSPEILEGCGWVLEGEENKLTDTDFVDILKYAIQQKARKDRQKNE